MAASGASGPHSKECRERVRAYLATTLEGRRRLEALVEKLDRRTAQQGQAMMDASREAKEDADAEEQILKLRLVEQEIQPVISPQQVSDIQDLTSQVTVERQIYRYIVRLGRTTRNEEETTPTVVREMVQHGISSRSLQHVLALARTHAFLAGREYVLPKDVKAIAVEALQHRIVRTIRAETEGVSGGEIITELLREVSLYD